MKNKRINLQLFAQEEAGQQMLPEAEAVSQETGEIPWGQNALEQQFQNHFRELERQAEEMKLYFPGFDLRRELKNPVFARMTAPGVGLSVEDAFYAVHRRELQAAAVQAAKQQVSNAIAAGAMRPRENGLSGQAPLVSSFDYRSASKEQREDLKRRIKQAAAEGKKLYPGNR